MNAGADAPQDPGLRPIFQFPMSPGPCPSLIQTALDREIARLEQQQAWLRDTFGDVFDGQVRAVSRSTDCAVLREVFTSKIGRGGTPLYPCLEVFS